MNRRSFLKHTAASAGVTVAPRLMGATQGVSIIMDPADSIAFSAPAQWAAQELVQALSSRGVAVSRCERFADAKPGDLCVIAAGSNFPIAKDVLKAAAVKIAEAPEAVGLVPGKASGKPALLVCGHDSRGLVYGLLDLADRVSSGAGVAALQIRRPVVEQPANTIRSVTRLFTSDVEDKPWYNDREMWPRYLTMLAAQRFNRFNLSFGIGYDFLRNVTDAYLLFSYPFLLAVPGYQVRASGLPDSERDRNLEMLKFISEQTVARGLQFQLGLWMHGYEWIDSPKPNYTIEGLTPETHGPYCRDAVRALLKACPAISGVTFRVHGESGVEEGSYEFWKTVFEGVATCGRKVEIDMHSKGMDQTMLDLAVASGMPIRVSPKYWAEHMGMTYHQADIRELEQPKAGRQATGLMKFSAGSRSFLRYGYGDLLREDRPWGVLHRIWPGTQRLLLWGDPMTAAAHSRAFSFCGSDGVEICEPLSFKGRRGSGIAGDRCAYADKTLKPRWDWEKYEYGHRVWGRLLYNPNSDPDGWRRYLRKHFGTAAEAAEAALANSSRILPIVTTAHAASAGNNSYWPEVYLNQSMIDAEHFGPYRDSPAPRVFGNVSPLDPQLFPRMNDFADQLLKGERDGKYSPIEVAQWLEDYAAAALKHLALLDAQTAGKDSPEIRRLAIDVALEAGLGRFFSAKFRSGVLYRIYEQSGSPVARDESLKAYRRARAAWAELANRAKSVYMSDITVGENPQLRGHWLDRLPAIDADIADLAGRPVRESVDLPVKHIQSAIEEALGRPRRVIFSRRHTPVEKFHPGQSLKIQLSFEKGPLPVSVRLYYRHVNQAERFESIDMQGQDNRYAAAIPASYTDTHYPLQYYFELKHAETAGLYPGFTADLTNQPYFVVRRA